MLNSLRFMCEPSPPIKRKCQGRTFAFYRYRPRAGFEHDPRKSSTTEVLNGQPLQMDSRRGTRLAVTDGLSRSPGPPSHGVDTLTHAGVHVCKSAERSSANCTPASPRARRSSGSGAPNPRYGEREICKIEITVTPEIGGAPAIHFSLHAAGLERARVVAKTTTRRSSGRLT